MERAERTASSTARSDSTLPEASGEGAHLPELVRKYLARSLPAGGQVPATVRVQQSGEMRQRPGGRVTSFRATEDFAVGCVAFSWRARFPIVGPLALTVVDEFADGIGRLRLFLLGIPLRTMTGTETNVGEAMRYLSELAWAPQAMPANRDLAWRELDARTVEVSTSLDGSTAVVELRFDAAGDIVRATGTRPFSVGKGFVPTTWGGDFGDYASFNGTRIPTSGQAWWDLPEGRFVYWRGRITALQLIEREERVMATFRKTRLRHLGDVLITPLARLGLAGRRTHILTVAGRKSGRPYTTPVQLVIQDGQRWLVAPYGEREWVKNARAAGEVELTRAGRTTRHAIQELGPDEAAPVLREYLRSTPIVKSYFDASADAPLEAFAAEASRHPVFLLAAPTKR